MIFTRHVTYQQIELLPEKDKRNIYNSPINRITPRPNDVLLFSSRLTHLVEPNISDQPRHSIAFNTFVKGQLGDYRAVTELKL
jgi:ectoine hydroxylase-related dioxygenase (phytanoyl-CoA dioxygenase family)